MQPTTLSANRLARPTQPLIDAVTVVLLFVFAPVFDSEVVVVAVVVVERAIDEVVPLLVATMETRDVFLGLEPQDARINILLVAVLAVVGFQAEIAVDPVGGCCTLGSGRPSAW